MRKSKLLWVIVLWLTLLVAACGNTSTTTAPESNNQTTDGLSTAAPSATQVNGTLQVHYIDVG
ncbi:MAG: hypothetical protein WA125_11995 [Desulfosporosinus sp.]